MTAGVEVGGPAGAFLMKTMTLASSPPDPTTTSSSVAGALACCDWQYGSAFIWMVGIFGAVPANLTVPVSVAASATAGAAAAAAGAVVVPLDVAEVVVCASWSCWPSSSAFDTSLPLPQASVK